MLRLPLDRKFVVTANVACNCPAVTALLSFQVKEDTAEFEIPYYFYKKLKHL